MSSIRTGFILPGGSATEQLEQAVLAEEHGWDAVFVWEAPYGVDAWSLLAAMATRTQRIRLGTMLTALPWRRPWKVASQVATVDQISGGRAILSVGLGAADGYLPDTGEVTDRRTRAAMMDEGIDLVKALWRGELDYAGDHYRYATTRAEFTEVVGVRPDIPVWVVGAWPRPKSMRRVLRCDGLIPSYDGDDWGPARLAEAVAWLRARTDRIIDIVVEGQSAGPGDADAVVRPWAEAGATWWLESRWEMPHGSAERMAQVRERLAAGPPRLSGS